jgi:hypothetical protein
MSHRKDRTKKLSRQQAVEPIRQEPGFFLQQDLDLTRLFP